MIVEQIMKRNVFSIDITTTIQQAIDLMDNNRIRHLPVINEKKELIGIVSDRDIRDARPSIFDTDKHEDYFLKPVSKIMVTNVITGHPLDFVEDISSIFYEHHIGCLPIEEDNKLVGIITETDLLHTLVQLMGAHQPSSQIEVQVENVAGMLAEIATIIKKRNINITSVLVYPTKDYEHKVLVFRLQTMDPRGVITDIEKEGYKIIWPNLPGMTP
ncbi:acetoin utilization protein AcuB [Anaerobacillus arseniciselenatis]|uniref:Acetoin utilization protein AcuB n=1 Tax=Anaerobacillus arseniciselenatis TaxID=85682 RepID=A0A1S2LHE2_9BACI|nr:acetoin utilization AcuB family protein [Anaerobacillus arseniciselenatis]OIJ10915.1 acetoin utilization protein AcuB [Anaerobacillus arseniciselenatis]